MLRLLPPHRAIYSNLSPEGTLKGEPKVVHLFLLSILLWSEKGIWHFQFTGGNPPFWNLENVLSPEGTPKGEPKVVQLFLLMFYPPKGRLLADSSRGPIFFTYVLISS